MRVAKLISIFLMVSLIFCAPVFAAAFSGQINEDNINARVDATVGSAVICSLPKGQLVEVVSEAYDWYKIRLPKEAPAYVKKDLVECINPDPAANPEKCLSAKVIKNRINIRLGPSESTWILGKADKLTVVNILGQESGWYKIQPIYQSYGWVNKKFVGKEITLTKEEARLPAKDIPSGELLVVEGTVTPYGVILWRKATHKLVTSANKIYFLKGNRKSLDSLNYHKVKVTGKLISPAANKYPIIQIDIIEALN